MISSCGRSNVDGYQFPCHDRHEKNGEANFNPCHLQLLSLSINQGEKGSICSCIHNGNPMLQVPSSWHMPVDMHSKPNGNYLSVKSVLQCCRCKSPLCANRSRICHMEEWPFEDYPGVLVLSYLDQLHFLLQTIIVKRDPIIFLYIEWLNGL